MLICFRAVNQTFICNILNHNLKKSLSFQLQTYLLWNFKFVKPSRTHLFKLACEGMLQFELRDPDVDWHVPCPLHGSLQVNLCEAPHKRFHRQVFIRQEYEHGVLVTFEGHFQHLTL